MRPRQWSPKCRHAGGCRGTRIRALAVAASLRAVVDQPNVSGGFRRIRPPRGLRRCVPVGNVGLLYVGAVLFLNGMMLLGKVDPRRQRCSTFRRCAAGRHADLPDLHRGRRPDMILGAPASTCSASPTSTSVSACSPARQHRRRLVLAVRRRRGPRVLVRELPAPRGPARSASSGSTGHSCGSCSSCCSASSWTASHLYGLGHGDRGLGHRRDPRVPAAHRLLAAPRPRSPSPSAVFGVVVFAGAVAAHPASRGSQPHRRRPAHRRPTKRGDGDRS